MDYQAFLNNEKSLLISPAGHGKTHTIAECLRHTKGRQLILTHTHAGIASLKEKFRKFDIPPSSFNIETISGFLQRYVLAYCSNNDLPVQGDNHFHSAITEKAFAIFQSRLTQAVLQASYAGVFIDEYQDCSMAQHNVLMKIADTLRCRILGDPLQGIFDFDGEIVDFEKDLADFEHFPPLPIPHRWQSNENNKNLGQLMVNIRDRLEAKKPFSLANAPDKGLHLIDTTNQNFADYQSIFGKELQKAINGLKPFQKFHSLLLIVPEYIREDGTRAGGINERADMLARIDFNGSITLLEAIDDKKFYLDARKIDDCIRNMHRARKPIKKIYEIFSLIFRKSSPTNQSNVGLNDWFSRGAQDEDWRVRRKRAELASVSLDFNHIINDFINSPTYSNFYIGIQFLLNTVKCRYHRRIGLAKDLIRCVDQANLNNCAVHDAMTSHKNLIRRSGRRIQNKCCGTTLLTKGLEFDTVVILDGHQFKCPKHFYVAATRCSKQLIIFSDGNRFSPYPES